MLTRCSRFFRRCCAFTLKDLGGAIPIARRWTRRWISRWSLSTCPRSPFAAWPGRDWALRIVIFTTWLPLSCTMVLGMWTTLLINPTLKTCRNFPYNNSNYRATSIRDKITYCLLYNLYFEISLLPFLMRLFFLAIIKLRCNACIFNIENAILPVNTIKYTNL